MTLFGIDISNNNGSGIDMAEVKAEGFDFVFCKVSEGSSFQDSTWPGYRDAAVRAGLLLAGYHFAIASAPPDSQVHNFRQHVGDLRIPVMIDFESSPDSTSGTIVDYWNLVRAFNAAGQVVALSYIPRWYHDGPMGGGDLSAVPGLISSSYPNGGGFAWTIYYDHSGGDSGDGWQPYGGRVPDIWQFTDRATVAGNQLDANAFRGTTTELVALLGLT